MSNYSERQEIKKIAAEKDRVRREKLAGFFFNLAQLTYTALVLGAIVLVFQKDGLAIELLGMFILGGVAAYAWAKMANNILKK